MSSPWLHVNHTGRSSSFKSRRAELLKVGLTREGDRDHSPSPRSNSPLYISCRALHRLHLLIVAGLTLVVYGCDGGSSPATAPNNQVTMVLERSGGYRDSESDEVTGGELTGGEEMGGEVMGGEINPTAAPTCSISAEVVEDELLGVEFLWTCVIDQENKVTPFEVMTTELLNKHLVSIKDAYPSEGLPIVRTWSTSHPSSLMPAIINSTEAREIVELLNGPPGDYTYSIPTLEEWRVINRGVDNNYACSNQSSVLTAVLKSDQDGDIGGCGEGRPRGVVTLRDSQAYQEMVGLDVQGYFCAELSPNSSPSTREQRNQGRYNLCDLKGNLSELVGDDVSGYVHRGKDWLTTSTQERSNQAHTQGMRLVRRRIASP